MLRDDNADLVSDDDLEVIGISTDSFFTLAAWKEAEGYQNTFLADFWPHGKVAEAYGAFDDRFGVAVRSTFLIDRDGILRYVERGSIETAGEARDQGAWREALAQLS